jgi:RHS repeat-associated protein
MLASRYRVLDPGVIVNGRVAVLLLVVLTAGPALGENEVDLRLPGQWVDDGWKYFSQAYNLHRWYLPQSGLYGKPDPAGLLVSNMDLYGYAARNPIRNIDPYGLRTCVVISGAELFSIGKSSLYFGDHSALLIDGPCKSNSECSSETGPLLYDPAGGYVAKFPGAGSSEVLSRNVPGWSFDSFFDYHCDSGSDVIEMYCFDTSCCEEKEIESQIPGGMQPGLCAAGVGEAVSGVGPFSGLGGTKTPAILRRAMNRILRNHSGPGGGQYWSFTCSGSSENR